MHGHIYADAAKLGFQLVHTTRTVYVHVEGKCVQLCGLNWSVRSCLSKTSGQNYTKIVAFQPFGAAICGLLKVCVCMTEH